MLCDGVEAEDYKDKKKKDLEMMTSKLDAKLNMLKASK